MISSLSLLRRIRIAVVIISFMRDQDIALVVLRQVLASSHDVLKAPLCLILEARMLNLAMLLRQSVNDARVKQKVLVVSSRFLLSQLSFAVTASPSSVMNWNAARGAVFVAVVAG